MRLVRTSRNLTLLDLPLFSSAKNFYRLSRRCWHSRPPYYFRPSLMQDRGAKFCSHRVGHGSALAQNASRDRSSFARIDFVPRPPHANTPSAIHLHARTTVSFVVAVPGDTPCVTNIHAAVHQKVFRRLTEKIFMIHITYAKCT